MEAVQNLDFETFRKILTSNRMVVFKIIHSVLLLGASMFLFIVLLLAFQHTDNSTKPQDILPVLTVAHVIIALPCYLISFILYQYMTGLTFFRKMKAPAGQLNTILEERYLMAVFTAYIIRAAFFEGIAMFGLIVCLMGALDGTIGQQPIYWLNLFSYTMLAVMVIGTFPTKTKLESIFQKRCILKPPHVC